MIPTPYKIIGLLLILLGIVVAAEYDGSSRVKAKWDKEKAAQVIADEKAKSAQATETVRVVTKYVNRIIKVKEASNGYDQAAKSLPDSCVLSGSFRLLHDSAALAIPYPTGNLDGAAQGIEAAAAARVIAANYATCNQNGEQLTALQDWVRQMEAAK